ncbi:MAG: hypothetical protein R3208_10310, partial [Ketobacteraceae bacterium]|nr:hypothetical protein [Ketobacteraceae bacterium]
TSPESNLEFDKGARDLEQVLVVAQRQKTLLLTFLVYLVLAGFSGALGPELKPLVQVLGLPLMIAVVVFTARLASRLYSTGGTVLVTILSFFPLLNLLTLLAVNSRANKFISNNGFRVGLVGADIKEIRNSM